MAGGAGEKTPKPEDQLGFSVGDQIRDEDSLGLEVVMSMERKNCYEYKKQNWSGVRRRVWKEEE